MWETIDAMRVIYTTLTSESDTGNTMSVTVQRAWTWKVWVLREKLWITVMTKHRKHRLVCINIGTVDPIMSHTDGNWYLQYLLTFCTPLVSLEQHNFFGWRLLWNVAQSLVLVLLILSLFLLEFRRGFLNSNCNEFKIIIFRLLLVSTCERLSVMHEPAGVVEILVQILRFTPILNLAPPPPPHPPATNLDLSISWHIYRIV